MGDGWKESFYSMVNHIENGEKIYKQLLTLRQEGVDLIVCPEHLGDTLWIAAMAKAYLKNHDCDKVQYVVKESQNEMVQHFPDIDGTISMNNEEMLDLEIYIIYKGLWNNEHIVYSHFRAKLLCAYPEFYKIQQSDLSEEANMLEVRKNILGISGECIMSNMYSLDDGNDRELSELFGNAVLLMPVAQSVEEIPLLFWERLAARYEIRGYTVYTNYNGFDYEKMIKGTKPLSTSIMELAQIGPYFAQVISLRSGACDLLAETNTNLSILYNHKVDEKKVNLNKNELGIDNIYNLIDRDNLFNYQYVNGMMDELIDELISQIK